VNEQFDDLFLGDPVVERDPQLPAQRLAGAERGGDGHRDKRPAAHVEARPRPGIPEGVPGGEPPEVSARRRLARAERKNQRSSEQPLGGVESGPVILRVIHQLLPP
jgi:hypothetical protein